MELVDAFARGALVVGTALHAGIVIAFAVLLRARARLGMGTPALVRAFRACGAVLGLSLGAILFAGAWQWPEAVNPGATGLDAWVLRWDTPRAQVQSLRAALLGLYWIDYIVVEIWLLEPARLLDRDGEVQDPAAYETAADAVARGLALGAASWLGILLLSALA